MPAIALSGGGSKCAFQVGAVRYLYNSGVTPDILCGVSGGAINAIKLAEGENPHDASQGLAGLETIWGSLNVPTDMFLEEPWLQDRNMHPVVRDALTGRLDFSSVSITAPDIDTGKLNPGYIITHVGDFIDAASWIINDGVPLLKSMQLMMGARSLYNLGPIDRRLLTQIDFNKIKAWIGSSRHLRLGMVGLESSALRWMTETGAIIERDGTPARTTGCPSERAAVDRLRSEIRGRQADVRDAVASNRPPILADIARLRRQLEAAIQALDACSKQSPPSNPPATGTLRQGVLASAAIPGVFPPVIIAGETYVDGGVRDVLPVREALRIGTDSAYAISAGSPFMEATPATYERASMVEIAARAVDILVDEVALGDPTPQAPWRIAPMPGTGSGRGAPRPIGPIPPPPIDTSGARATRARWIYRKHPA